MKPAEKVLKAIWPLAYEEQETEQRYTLTVSPAADADLSLRQEGEEGLIEISAAFPFDFQKQDLLFLNGYQSWTYSPERTLKEFDRSMKYCPKSLDFRFGFSRYGDDHFVPRPSKKELKGGYRKGYSYAYVRRGDEYYLFASLAEDTGFTRIIFMTGESKIVFKKDCHHRALQKDERYLALDLFFAHGTEQEVFDLWFEALHVEPVCRSKKTGYTSWYNYYQNISEPLIIRDLEGMHNLQKRPDIFQIDDGFETFVGDWFDVDPVKFPNGLEHIARQIVADGFQAGLWLSPFVCEKKSKLFAEHPDWLQRKNGEPVFTGGNWSGAYALDPYHPEVRDYIRSVVDHYKKMGFSLFKLDFLYGACMTSRPNKTRGEIMSDAMSFLRDVCGDAHILACGVPLASAFGKVDYCRIGPDVSLRFNDVLFMRLFHNERPSTMHTQRNTVYRRQLNGRAFQNDPDVFLLRDENISLNQEQKRTLAVINALLGSLLFTSDNYGTYNQETYSFFEYLCSLQRAENVRLTTKRQGHGHHMDVSFELDGQVQTMSLDF
ncbi:MAG: alpha-galactosidase [Clostridia bacterium]|nr:alpha-galactosidase [Clostridia bacterium]